MVPSPLDIGEIMLNCTGFCSLVEGGLQSSKSFILSNKIMASAMFDVALSLFHYTRMKWFASLQLQPAKTCIR